LMKLKMAQERQLLRRLYQWSYLMRLKEKIFSEVKIKYQKQLSDSVIHLQLNVSKDVIVLADPLSLSIMIDNLFSNALKYGEKNGKIICEWDGSKKTFSISNNGPDIPQDQIPYLFNRFFRTDQSRSSQTPGSGLGLAIVKKLADLQDITVLVRSDAGQTTFLLQFPE